ncbi:DUF2062 domain-containing protein [Porphyrobacter sp. GA68]|uniref:DUF2062 domain-containing protein n=1 Tax=Porphyrobacter sp. GA68 TaxID=2883480 RepID=UPI001D1959EF|nr:DUF2062 domain-containing protein [Porphyrobacter sp. GA68]
MRKRRLADRLPAWAKPTMPKREEMAQNRWLAPIAHRFLSPELWRFTRRSVPRGIALGLFCAFIVPVGQIFLAAFLALPTRANVPLAALATFITNPFTLAFWIGIAKFIGEFILRHNQAAVVATEGWSAWLLETAGVVAFGFLTLAVVASTIGYLIAGVVWQRMVLRRRHRQLQRLEMELDRRLREQGDA